MECVAHTSLLIRSHGHSTCTRRVPGVRTCLSPVTSFSSSLLPAALTPLEFHTLCDSQVGGLPCGLWLPATEETVTGSLHGSKTVRKHFRRRVFGPKTNSGVWEREGKGHGEREGGRSDSVLLSLEAAAIPGEAWGPAPGNACTRPAWTCEGFLAAVHYSQCM